MKKFSILLFVLISGDLRSQSAEEILEKYYQAVGSKERWLSINSRIDRIETIRIADTHDHHRPLQSQINEIDYKYAFRKDSIVWDRFISFLSESPWDTTTSCFNGTSYWVQKSGNPIGDFDYYADRYGKFANLGYPDLLIRSESSTFTGIQIVDGIKCNVLSVTIDQTEFDYYFDTVTGYLVMYHYKDNDLHTKLSDYRNVDGVVIPFKTEVVNMYGFVSTSITKEVTLNLSIADSFFEKGIRLGYLIR